MVPQVCRMSSSSSDQSESSFSLAAAAGKGEPFRDQERESSLRASAVIEKVTDPQEEVPSLPNRVKTLLIGRPRDLTDKNVFQHVSLIAFLAWVGLGADGLSSSCYGPPEAFHHLGPHSYLAIGLSLATILTVLIISKCYCHIIEEFPSGGGGYLVASKLLGARAG